MHTIQLKSDKSVYPSICFPTQMDAIHWLRSCGFAATSDKDWVRRPGCQIIVNGESLIAKPLYATVLPIHEAAQTEFTYGPWPTLAYHRPAE